MANSDKNSTHRKIPVLTHSNSEDRADSLSRLLAISEQNVSQKEELLDILQRNLEKLNQLYSHTLDENKKIKLAYNMLKSSRNIEHNSHIVQNICDKCLRHEESTMTCKVLEQYSTIQREVQTETSDPVTYKIHSRIAVTLKPKNLDDEEPTGPVKRIFENLEYNEAPKEVINVLSDRDEDLYKKMQYQLADFREQLSDYQARCLNLEAELRKEKQLTESLLSPKYVDIVQVDINDTDRYKKMEDQLANFRQRLAICEDRCLNLEADLRNEKKLTESLYTEKCALEDTLNNRDDELQQDMKYQWANLRQQLANCQDKCSKLEGDLRTEKQEQYAQTKILNRGEELYQQMEVELANLRQQLAKYQNKCSNLEADLRKEKQLAGSLYSDQQDKRKHIVDDDEELFQDMDRELVSLQQKLAVCQDKCSHLEGDLRKEKQLTESLYSEKHALEAKLNNRDEELDKNQLADLRQQLAKCKEKCSQLQADLREEKVLAEILTAEKRALEANSHNRGDKGDQNQMADLRQQLAKCQEKCSHLEADLREKAEMADTLIAEKSTLEANSSYAEKDGHNKMANLRQQLANCQEKCSRLEADLREKAEMADTLIAEKSTLEANSSYAEKDGQNQMANLRQQLAKCQEKCSRLEADLREKAEMADALISEKRTLEANSSYAEKDGQNQMANLRQQLAKCQEKCSRLEVDLREKAEMADTLISEKRTLEANSSRAEKDGQNQMANLRQQLAKWQEKCSRLEADLREKVEMADTLISEKRTLEANSSRAEKDGQNQIADLRQQLAKCQEKCSGLEADLRERMELAEALLTEKQDLEASLKKRTEADQNQLADLRQQLAKYQEKCLNLEADLREKVELAEALLTEKHDLEASLKKRTEADQNQLADLRQQLANCQEKCLNLEADLRERMELAETILTEKCDLEAKLAEENARFSDLLEQEKSASFEKEQTIIGLNEALLSLKSKLTDSESERDRLNKVVNELSPLSAEVAEIGEELVSLRKKSEALRQELALTIEERDELLNEKAQLLEKLEIIENQIKQLEISESEFLQLAEERDQLKSRLEEILSDGKCMEDKICDLEKDQLSLMEQIDRLRQDKDALNGEYERCKQAVKDLETKIEQLDKAKINLETLNATLQKEKGVIAQTNSDLNAAIASLQSKLNQTGKENKVISGNRNVLLEEREELTCKCDEYQDANAKLIQNQRRLCAELTETKQLLTKTQQDEYTLQLTVKELNQQLRASSAQENLNHQLTSLQRSVSRYEQMQIDNEKLKKKMSAEVTALRKALADLKGNYSDFKKSARSERQSLRTELQKMREKLIDTETFLKDVSVVMELCEAYKSETEKENAKIAVKCAQNDRTRTKMTMLTEENGLLKSKMDEFRHLIKHLATELEKIKSKCSHFQNLATASSKVRSLEFSKCDLDVLCVTKSDHSQLYARRVKSSLCISTSDNYCLPEKLGNDVEIKELMCELKQQNQKLKFYSKQSNENEKFIETKLRYIVEKKNALMKEIGHISSSLKDKLDNEDNRLCICKNTSNNCDTNDSSSIIENSDTTL